MKSRENWEKRALWRVILPLLLAAAAALSGCAGLLPDAGQIGAGQTSSVSGPQAGTLQVDFIDVGQGDSILLQCEGEAMLVDGGPSDASNVVYTYLEQRELQELKAVVATHCDADHCGGLSGALEYARAETVYCSSQTYDSRAFQSFAQRVEQQGLEIRLPQAGETFSLGGADVEILAPITLYDGDNNNNSIVLRVTYGAVSFLLTGDASRQEEQDLLDSGCDLSATVLKVGHHGSRSSTSYAFLREVMPEYAVIQVGKDNEYGHPTEEVLSRLRDAEVTVYRTDLQGDIICVTDGESVTFSTARNAQVQTNPTEAASEETVYIGNANTHRYHLPQCPSVGEMKAENQVEFDSAAAAEAAGYAPCGRCIKNG